MHPSIFSHLSKSLSLGSAVTVTTHATLSQLGNVVFLSWVCAALLLVGHAPKTPDLGSSRTHVGQIPEPPQLWRNGSSTSCCFHLWCRPFSSWKCSRRSSLDEPSRTTLSRKGRDEILRPPNSTTFDL